ncbi:MAG: sigma 54-interacting transcriptional regulator [Clostridiales Family XIII bacterium]|jgi:transcriptional regulator with PAS, ATPase and Fis domain|nr:sigma 54-interacting transcriptional regulator [Clostridiales Family XIII bacterium]
MEGNTVGYEKLVDAINHMNGTLLICNKDRKVVFYNRQVLDALAIPEEILAGANLQELAEKKYIINSASIQAFDTGKPSIKYVQGHMSIPILTLANPVFDEEGEIDYVVAISINEEVFESVNMEMFKARLKDMQIQTYLSDAVVKESDIIFESESMNNILAFLNRCSQNDSNILLTGETGVGKEVLAKHIHRLGVRNNAVFIPVNCAAIPETLVEAEFFGYIKGAFTGADKNGRIGFFEMANGGTLFLDEIGEMPLPIQAKLLRVIETGEITRLGSTKIHKIDFRLIAATNRDLEELCKQGAFREDLYFRLNILSVEIPPLRNRREDILPLAKHFIAELNKKYGTNKILSHAAREQLERYRWPGNVRELRNVIERLMLTSDSDILDFENTQAFLHGGNMRQPGAGAQEGEGAGEKGGAPSIESLKSAVDDYEKRVIIEALNVCDFDVPKAASWLKIDKSSLYRKLQKYQDAPIPRR